MTGSTKQTIIVRQGGKMKRRFLNEVPIEELRAGMSVISATGKTGFIENIINDFGKYWIHCRWVGVNQPSVVRHDLASAIILVGEDDDYPPPFR